MARRKPGQFQIMIAQLADLARIGTLVRFRPVSPFFDSVGTTQYQLARAVSVGTRSISWHEPVSVGTSPCQIDLSSRSTLSRSRSIANGLRM